MSASWHPAGGKPAVSRYHRREEGARRSDIAIVERELQSLFANKAELRRLMAEQNEKMGVVHDPTATAKKGREMMLALGIKPEENLLSQGIIEMRNEE